MKYFIEQLRNDGCNGNPYKSIGRINIIKNHKGDRKNPGTIMQKGNVLQNRIKPTEFPFVIVGYS